jgi:hypothetical protein
MRVIVPLLIFASAASLYSMTGFADSCHSPSPPSSFPEPSTATGDDILAVQQSIKQYLTEMELALKCLDAAHNDHARDAAVDDMRKTAAKYNVVLRSYRARQKG